MMIIRKAFCPVCFMTHGREVLVTVVGKPWIVLKRGNFWAGRTVDPDKPFGVIQESKGRGTLKMLGYFEPEEDEDGYFPLVKGLLIAAVKKWLDRGWLTREELEEGME